MLKSILRFPGAAKRVRVAGKSRSTARVAQMVIASVFLSSACLAVAPAKAAVTFGAVPVGNKCPPAPNFILKGLSLFEVNNNVIYIAPDDAKVVNTTINRAGWNAIIFTPPGNRVINPGQVCVFEKCTAASLTLTCIMLPQTPGVDGVDSGVSVEWPAED